MRRTICKIFHFCFNWNMKPSCQTLSNAFDISRNTPRSSYPSANDTYIPWVIDRSRMMQESPDLKCGLSEEIRWFVMKRSNISLYKKRSSNFPNIGKLRSTGSLLLFFTIPVERCHFLSMISKQFQGVYILMVHIFFNIRTLILSWPCAFTECKFWIILRMSWLEKVILDKNLCFKQELRRQTLPIINCSALISQTLVKYISFLCKIS